MVRLKANKFQRGITLLFIILHHPPDPSTLQAPEAVTILHLHLGALGPGRFWSRRGVGLSSLSLSRSYSNLLSIFQIGHQWSDWLLRWITSFSWFYYLSGWQSRLAGPSRPSLDFLPFRSLTIKKDQLPIEDQWKEVDVNVLRVGPLTASGQPSCCCFTHGRSGDRELFSLNQRIGKALALLWVDTQVRGLIKLSWVWDRVLLWADTQAGQLDQYS